MPPHGDGTSSSAPRSFLIVALLALAVLATVVGRSGFDDCRGDGFPWGAAIYAPSPLVGLAVYLMTGRRETVWRVLLAVVIGAAAGGGALFLGLVAWAEACTN